MISKVYSAPADGRRNTRGTRQGARELVHILIFVGFMLLYAGWVWANVAVAKVIQRTVLENKLFWPAELNGIVSLAALLGFVVVLTRYFDWRLAVALFVAMQIGILFTVVLSGLTGTLSLPWGARAYWAGAEFSLKHQRLTLALTAFSLLVVLAYPAVGGIAYFGLPPPELPARIFQYTFGLMFVSGLPIVTMIVGGNLLSENLDEDTRKRLFINQSGMLVPSALWLALLYWSFGSGALAQQFDVAEVSLVFSPVLVGILIGYFVLAVLFPYLIGARRGKQKRTFLLEQRKAWMIRLMDVLERPTGALYLNRLSALRARLSVELDQFVASDRMIASGIEMNAGRVPQEMKVIAPAYRLARGEDSRFGQLDWLHTFAGTIGEIFDDLDRRVAAGNVETAAMAWATYLRSRNAELDREIARAASTRTPAMLIASGVLVPIFGVIVSEFAKWLWTFFGDSLPQ